LLLSCWDHHSLLQLLLLLLQCGSLLCCGCHLCLMIVLLLEKKQLQIHARSQLLLQCKLCQLLREHIAAGRDHRRCC
jgi:hypothetical protein